MIYIDKYAYISGFRKISPYIKSAFALSTMLTGLFIRSRLLFVTIIVSMFLLCVTYGRIPVLYYLKIMAIPLVFLVFSTIGIVIGISGNYVDNPHIRLLGFYFYISTGGIETAVFLMLRSFGCVSCLYFLVLSTPISEICQVMKSLRLPALFLELTAFVYRFIFILMDIAATKQSSVKSRFGYNSRQSAFRAFGMLVGSIFIQSFLRSQSIYRAMAARGYDGNYQVLSKSGAFSWKLMAGVIGYVMFLIALGIISAK